MISFKPQYWKATKDKGKKRIVGSFLAFLQVFMLIIGMYLTYAPPITAKANGSGTHDDPYDSSSYANNQSNFCRDIYFDMDYGYTSISYRCYVDHGGDVAEGTWLWGLGIGYTLKDKNGDYHKVEDKGSEEINDDWMSAINGQPYIGWTLNTRLDCVGVTPMLRIETPSRDGYKFIGWQTDFVLGTFDGWKNGDGSEYFIDPDDGNYWLFDIGCWSGKIDGNVTDVTIRAMWEATPSLSISWDEGVDYIGIQNYDDNYNYTYSGQAHNFSFNEVVQTNIHLKEGYELVAIKENDYSWTDYWTHDSYPGIIFDKWTMYDKRAISIVTKKISESYILDLNAMYYETSYDSLKNFGTCDLYINGQCVATNISDWYQSYPEGTTYEFKNFKMDGYYAFSDTGILKGTIGNSDIDARVHIYNRLVLNYYDTDTDETSDFYDAIHLDSDNVVSNNSLSKQNYTFNGWVSGKNKYNSNDLIKYYDNKQGIAVIRNMIDDRVCDITGGNNSDGTNIQLWYLNTDMSERYDAQTWGLLWSTDGYFFIVSSATGRFLGVSDDKDVWGITNVTLQNLDWSEKQQWKFIPAGDGYYYIQSRYDNNLVLDAQGGRVNGQNKNGQNVCVYPKNYTEGQKWKLDYYNRDTYFKADWTPTNYTISYNLNGGSASNPTSYNIESDTFTLSNPTRTGYIFAGWTGSNGSTKQTSVSIVKGSYGNKSYTANWTPVNYSISYNLNGGSANNPTSYNIESDTFTLNNPKKTGYTFIGWSGSNGNINQINVTIQKGSINNKSYEAHWSPNNYKIIFNYNKPANATGNVITGDNSKEMIYDATIGTLPNATLTGWSFDGWYFDDGTKLTGSEICKFTSDITVTAHWTPNTYTVRVKADKPATASNSINALGNVRGWTYENGTYKTTFTYDAENYLPESKQFFSLKGWTAVNWNINEYGTCRWNLSSNQDGEVIISALFKENKYTIHFDTEGGTLQNSILAGYEDTISMPPIPFRPGYSFVEWNTMENGSGNRYSSSATVKQLVDNDNGNYYLYAMWQKKKTTTLNLTDSLGTINSQFAENIDSKWMKTYNDQERNVIQSWNVTKNGFSINN